jgi:hypothetical protein
MPRPSKTPAVLKREQRAQRLEDVAFAAYQMERGEYPYAKGVPRGHKKPDGTRDWNRQELMRVYGWPNSQNYAAVLEDPHFLRTLEYHRWRGSDPMFRKKVQNTIWREIGEELSMQVYEQVKFHPDKLSYDQKLKTIKLIVDAGVKLASEKTKNKADELLGALDERERQALVDEHRKSLERQLRDLDSLEQAVEVEVEVERKLTSDVTYDD